MVVAAGAAFILAGFSETVGILAVAVFGLFWLTGRRAERLIVFAGALAGLVTVGLAPGNAARSSVLGDRLPILVATTKVGTNVLDLLTTQAQSNWPVYATLVVIGLIAGRQHLMRRRWQRAVLVILGALAAGIVLVFPSVWVGGITPARHYTVVMAIWTSAALAVGWILGCSEKPSSLAC